MRIAMTPQVSGAWAHSAKSPRRSSSVSVFPDQTGLPAPMRSFATLGSTEVERSIWLREAVFRNGLISKLLLHLAEYSRSHWGKHMAAYASIRMMRVSRQLKTLHALEDTELIDVNVFFGNFFAPFSELFKPIANISLTFASAQPVIVSGRTCRIFGLVCTDFFLSSIDSSLERGNSGQVTLSIDRAAGHKLIVGMTDSSRDATIFTATSMFHILGDLLRLLQADFSTKVKHGGGLSFGATVFDASGPPPNCYSYRSGSEPFHISSLHAVS